MNRPSRCSTALTRQPLTPNSPILIQNQTKFRKQRQKESQYLTPRQQCFSAQGNRNETPDKSTLKFSKTQVKLQSKIQTPVLNINAKQEELKNKINKLGLENFMKDIVLSQRIGDPQFSTKVIHALNKTYIQNGLEMPKRQFKSIFGKRFLKESRRMESPRVEWNPEKELAEVQFTELNTYIPNTMFPCRRDKTSKLLKSKYKKKMPTFQNPVQDPVKKLLSSQQRHNYSLNLLQNKKAHPMYSSSSKHRNKFFFLNSPSVKTDSKSLNMSKSRKQDEEILFLCGKVKIHA